MMTNKKTRSSHLLKLLALVPIVGTTLALNARTVTDYVYDEPQKQQPIKKGKKAGKINAGTINEIVVVEQAPQGEDNSVRTLKGQVYCTEDMKPVEGAVVRIAGSKKGTVTDRDGRFTIEAAQNDQLEFMYVGMRTTKMSAKFVIDYMTRTGQESQVPMSKEEKTTERKSYDVVEQMPAFPGGQAAMMQYLAQNIRYPEEAHKNGIQGRVIANFTVEKDGSISDPHVVRSIDPLLDAEALRVLSAMPKWTPGKQNGEPVAVKYTVPVTFRLDGGKESAPDALPKKDVDVEVDGKLVDASALETLKPGEIELISIKKAKDNGGRSKIVITTKKKD